MYKVVYQNEEGEIVVDAEVALYTLAAALCRLRAKTFPSITFMVVIPS